MRIALLGATSQIAKDLIVSFATHNEHELVLFARRPEAVSAWLAQADLAGRYVVADFAAFGIAAHFDAILNFVGVGNPAQAAAMGASIFDVTLQFDQMALDYVRQHPHCRYIFLSSGAAYGASFNQPVDQDSKAVVAINNLQSQDWYGAAKLHAECRHRSLASLPIVDVRVFNYFSHTQDMAARFFITDMLRAIQSGDELMTSAENIVRDYIGPNDFYQLISRIMSAPASNDVLDCYTQAPVDKLTILAEMNKLFGLRYAVAEAAGVNATGFKLNYYSNNKRATAYGYLPAETSLGTVLLESGKYINTTALPVSVQ